MRRQRVAMRPRYPAVMKILKRIAALLVLLLVAVAAWIAVQSQRRPPLAPYAALLLPPAPAGSTPRVQFAGVCTLVFDDGETALMTDGFFSRPGFATVALSKIAPDERAVDAGLAALKVSKLAAVIPVHGHYDHAMDAPLVARKTGALLLGDESVMNVGRGAGLPEAAMRKVAPGDTLSFGAWTLHFIAGRHAPTPFSDGSGGEHTLQPLKPPARANEWREGQTWSLLVEHRSGRSYVVQGSAGFMEGALRGRRADVVFLGIGALGKQPATYRTQLWREVVDAVGARRVVLVHWDDFTLGLDRPLQPMPALADDFEATMADYRAVAASGRQDLRLPPLFIPFDPAP
jgi:L-ascorbate metabolism protein UlaG (beta-lactamase superfamily)